MGHAGSPAGHPAVGGVGDAVGGKQYQSMLGEAHRPALLPVPPPPLPPPFFPAQQEGRCCSVVECENVSCKAGGAVGDPLMALADPLTSHATGDSLHYLRRGCRRAPQPLPRSVTVAPVADARAAMGVE